MSTPVPPLAPPIFTPFLLYGAGQLTPQELFNQVYTNKWVQFTIAIGLALLISFEHELAVFSRRETFLLLLAITVALVFLEYTESPGLVALMAALTAISFQMGTRSMQSVVVS